MNKRNILLYSCAVGMLLLIALGGCASKRVSREAVEYNPQAVSHYEIDMILNPLTEEELIARFGTRNNPFLMPELFMNRKTYKSFEVTIANNTKNSADEDNAIKVPLKTVRVLYAYKAVPPLTRFKLKEFWEAIDERDSQVRDMSKLLHIVQKHVFPTKLTVEPGSTYTGILVFSSKFPRGGEGEVEIAAYTKTNEIIGVFREGFNF